MRPQLRFYSIPLPADGSEGEEIHVSDTLYVPVDGRSDVHSRSVRKGIAMIVVPPKSPITYIA